MANERREVLLVGPSKPAIERGFADFTVHSLAEAKNREAFFGSIGHVRAVAVSLPVERINEASFDRLPKLEIIASFGVGYDHIDAAAAAKRGIVVTHTPDDSLKKWPTPRSVCCFPRCANCRRPNAISAAASGPTEIIG